MAVRRGISSSKTNPETPLKMLSLAKKKVDSLCFCGMFPLIISDFHTRLAEDYVKKAGLKIHIYPVVFYATDWEMLDPFDLIPSEGPIARSLL